MIFFAGEPLTDTLVMADNGVVSRAGVASGVNNAVARTAGLLAIAVFTLPMIAIFGARLDRELARAGVAPAVAQAARADVAKLGGLTAPASASPSDRFKVEAAVKTSFVAGFRFVTLASAGLAFLGAATAFVLLPKRR